MVFACQKNSFKKEFVSTVVSCSPAVYQLTENGKKHNLNCFEIILGDTIFFPEGGGQPCDFGTLNDVKVLHVFRRGDQAVHYVEKPIKEGEEVIQKINWERRFDHMQQHSGQHLLSAIVENEFGYATTSWWLGEDVSFIELDTLEVTAEEVNTLQNLVNESIKQALPVTVKVYEEGDDELAKSSTRGLPKDHIGSVRVIEIEGIDSNMCCGTHVTNLAQLQVLQLLNCEKGKKGKLNLNFLVGNRVLMKFQRMFKNELGLTSLLRNGPEIHIDLIDKLQRTVKITNKKAEQMMKDLIYLEVKSLKEMVPYPKVHTIHRVDADMDYINTFIRILSDKNILLMMTVGDKEGYLVLHGPEDKVAELGPKLSEMLDGKGNGKGTRYQAKVKNFKNLSKAQLLITNSVQL